MSESNEHEHGHHGHGHSHGLHGHSHGFSFKPTSNAEKSETTSSNAPGVTKYASGDNLEISVSANGLILSSRPEEPEEAEATIASDREVEIEDSSEPNHPDQPNSKTSVRAASQVLTQRKT
jgi:hypothetical protein